jgi:hypothetical protein
MAAEAVIFNGGHILTFTSGAHAGHPITVGGPDIHSGRIEDGSAVIGVNCGTCRGWCTAELRELAFLCQAAQLEQPEWWRAALRHSCGWRCRHRHGGQRTLRRVKATTGDQT